MEKALSPIFLTSDGTTGQIRNRVANTAIVTTPVNLLTDHHDYFYVQLAVEPVSGTLTFSGVGMLGPGTQAVGYYTAAELVPNRAMYTKKPGTCSSGPTRTTTRSRTRATCSPWSARGPEPTLGGMPLPPGPATHPAIQMARWVHNPFPVLDECRARFGDMFTLRLPIVPNGMVLVSDPGARQGGLRPGP